MTPIEANKLLSKIKCVKELQASQSSDGKKFLSIIIYQNECSKEDKIKLYHIKQNTKDRYVTLTLTNRF